MERELDAQEGDVIALRADRQQPLPEHGLPYGKSRPRVCGPKTPSAATPSRCCRITIAALVRVSRSR